MKQKNEIQYIIKNAEFNDIPELIRMRILLQKHMDTANSKTLRYKDDLKDLLQRDYEILLNDNNIKILIVKDVLSNQSIGMMAARLNRHEYFTTPLSVQIDGVWVDYAYRNSGICKSLLKDIVEYYKEKNINLFTLDTVINNYEAEKTWRSLGFEPVMQNFIARIEDLKI